MFKEKIIIEMKEVFKEIPFGIEHTLKVLKNAEDIMKGENIGEEEKEFISIIAILHDIGAIEAQKKYGSIDGVYQEKEGPEVAKEILKKVGYNKNIDRICFVIPSKAVCVIVVILVAFSGMFLSEMTVQKLEESKTLPDVIINADGTHTLVDGDRPNPKYVDGTPRKMLYAVHNVMPQAQISEYCSLLARWNVDWEETQIVDTSNCDVTFKDHITVTKDLKYRFFANQLILITLATLGGLFVFNKKNLK